ncbi:MAG: efflux RND transporter periplasmic adaptor subunit [Betaproteobacteria bacterium]
MRNHEAPTIMDKPAESAARTETTTSSTVGHPARRKIVHAVLASATAIALIGGSYYGWSIWKANGDAAGRPATAVVQRGDIEDAVTATGILQPRDYVDVGTQVSGQLRTLHVEIGARVEKGKLLAEIDPTVYKTRVDADRAQINTLAAQLSDREAQLALAEQQHLRQVNMMREQATTREALQSAEAALKSAKAQINVLKAQIEQTRSSLRGNEANLGYTKIYAPMTGTVVSIAARQGQTLNANQQAPIILRIADLSTMTVQSQVSEADVSRLRLGMDVYFTTLGSQTKRWSGKLRQVNPTPEIVNNVVLYNALFDVENHDGALMTQMTAQIFFVTAQAKNVVQVPVAALRPAGRRPQARESRRTADADTQGAVAKGGARRGGPQNADRSRYTGGRATVQVMKDDGVIEDREVRVGVVSRVAAEIVSGLEPGEKVVTGTAAPAGQNHPRTATANAPRMSPRI